VKAVDVVIVGGGIVGTVLAKGLSENVGLNVALVDAAQPQKAEVTFTATQTETSKCEDKPVLSDTRVIALARRTVHELAHLGIDVNALSELQGGERPPEIKQIEVSDQGHLGLVDLHSDDYRIDAFGKVVSLRALTQFAMNVSTSYEHIAPAKVTSLIQHKAHTTVVLSNNRELKAKLLILADGGRSGLAEQVGITKTIKDYQQTAIVFNVHTQLPHNNKAYERFTPTGPLAFLPFDSNICGVNASGSGFSVVWTVNSHEAEQILALSDDAFLSKLQAEFGYRQGKILRVSNKETYPLALTFADDVTAHRTLVVGNAAQALHPIAGQGFNLGLRDIYTLVETLKEAKQQWRTMQAKVDELDSEKQQQAIVDGDSDVDFDAGTFDIIHRYAKCRTTDRNNTILLTDTLVRTFSNSYVPTVMGRNISLLLLGILPSAKSAFVKQTTGYGNGAVIPS